MNYSLRLQLGLYLGVEKNKILSVIPCLKPVKHRSEVIKTTTGITVIDDGYNANLEGIKSTSQAISQFDGFKVAVTAGVVELGVKTKEINYAVGEVLAKTFDLIICVGANGKYIALGVGGKVKTIEIEKLSDCNEIIKRSTKSGDVVAFFNDVPDRY